MYWKIKISRKKFFRLCIVNCSWITQNSWNNGLIRCCIFIHKSSNSVGIKHSQATSKIPSWSESTYKFFNYRPNYIKDLKFAQIQQIYFLWKTLHTSFWNSDGLSRFISSCKLSHGRRWKTCFKNFADLPRLWKRYLDDIFVIMKKSKLSEIFNQINTIESFIQFTM